MAEKYDPKKISSLIELLVINSIQIEALIDVLSKKRIISKEEYFRVLKKEDYKYDTHTEAADQQSSARAVEGYTVVDHDTNALNILPNALLGVIESLSGYIPAIEIDNSMGENFANIDTTSFWKGTSDKVFSILQDLDIDDIGHLSSKGVLKLLKIYSEIKKKEQEDSIKDPLKR